MSIALRLYLFLVIGLGCFQSTHPVLSTYGTHLPMVAAVVNQTEGPILEMGSGHFSTPMLHSLCMKTGRTLYTYDTDKKWLGFFRYVENAWHKLIYVPVYEDDWEKNPKPWLWNGIGGSTHWSVVFIDHRPGERRIEDVRRLRKNTDIFIVHDTEEAGYQYEPTLSSFKYVYTFSKYRPYTTVVSDTVDVSKLFDY